jgi:hypothetical protein
MDTDTQDRLGHAALKGMQQGQELASCPCLNHVPCPCPCCMSMFMLRVPVMLPVHVHAACSSPYSRDVDMQSGHGHVAWI